MHYAVVGSSPARQINCTTPCNLCNSIAAIPCKTIKYHAARTPPSNPIHMDAPLVQVVDYIPTSYKIESVNSVNRRWQRVAATLSGRPPGLH